MSAISYRDVSFAYPDRAGAALRDHLELATAIFSVELAGRSIFAF